MSKHFVAGYLGTLGMAHALHNVLDAADLLRETNVRFLFVGPGAEREKLGAEARRRVLANVIFVPPQPKQNMPRFWSLCDVALVHLRDTPLFRTVIPSKIFEAMGMGLPIILASPPGEGSRIVERERAGLVVPPEDPRSLATAVLRLRDDPDLCRHFARCSRDAAILYSRERQARDMLAVLDAVHRRAPLPEVGQAHSPSV